MQLHTLSVKQTKSTCGGFLCALLQQAQKYYNSISLSGNTSGNEVHISSDFTASLNTPVSHNKQCRAETGKAVGARNLVLRISKVQFLKQHQPSCNRATPTLMPRRCPTSTLFSYDHTFPLQPSCRQLAPIVLMRDLAGE